MSHGFRRAVFLTIQELRGSSVPPVTTMTLPLRSGSSVSGSNVFGIVAS